MKQQLWILNISLLGLFGLTLLIGMFTQQTPPRFRLKKTRVEEREIQKDVSIKGIETIYKYDLFGTFQKKEVAPQQRSFVTAIPQPKPVTVPPPPELPKPTFLDPLKVVLQGIAFASDEEKSITMITDETKKERIYHVGDSLKDAQVIKIDKHKVTLLRTNGQHETLFLRKEDNKKLLTAKEKWEGIVKKIDETNFEIDIRKFPKKIESLGRLLETLSLLTVYEKGKPTGLKVANLAPQSVGLSLGLKKSDIITDIDSVSMTEAKNRIQVYDKLTGAKVGDTVKVEFQRGGEPMTLNYKLAHIEEMRKKEFAPTPEKVDAAQPEDTKKEDVLFKLNRLQKREKKRRKFAKKHKGRQNKAIEEIRRRLLQNIRSRVRNTRIR